MATALVQEVAHEYLGVASAILVVAHVGIHRRWFTALGKGRWTAVRVVQTLAIAGLVVCLVGQVASALILSKHALWFLPALPGAAWARSAHMLCSYWMFMFAFAHAGVQLKLMLARMGALPAPKGPIVWVLRAVWAIVAVAGVVSFVQLGLADYLFGRVHFAFINYETPLVLTFAQYASIGALVAGAFHYLRVALSRR